LPGPRPRPVVHEPPDRHPHVHRAAGRRRHRRHVLHRHGPRRRRPLTPTKEPPTAVPLSDQTLSKAEELIARYPQRRSALLPILFLLQAEDGYVSPAGVAQVAELLGLTKAEIGAVATFYTMFRRRPVGKYLVSVCKTLPCQLRGSREISAAIAGRL